MATILVKVDRDAIGATINIHGASGRVSYAGQFQRVVPSFERRLSDFSPVAPQARQIMRIGPGSVGEQFDQEAEQVGTSTLKWPKTKPFGNRPAPAKTLQRSGALRAAWLGGAGAYDITSQNAFGFGVTHALIPYARVHQSLSPTVVRSRKQARNRKGTAMHYFLGLTYGAWISEERLRRGLVIPPRRVGIGETMKKRVANFLVDWVLGLGPSRSEFGPGGSSLSQAA